MKKLRPIFILIFLSLALLRSESAKAETAMVDIASEMKAFASANDLLGLRILALKAIDREMTDAERLAMRRILHSKPTVGWDVLLKWDHAINKSNSTDSLISEGDRLLKEKDFSKAFQSFQKAAQRLKANLGDNDILYMNVLHSMARSLFGDKRYADATMVYGWISPLYPFFRQTLFERMWSAFRAEKFDIANGTIASQYSTYFSRFPDPETFLVQIYLYKKLCRAADLKRVSRQAARYRAELRRGTYGVTQWAKGDNETRAYLQLYQQSSSRSSDFVSESERTKERAALKASMKARFDKIRPTLNSQIEIVISLAADAVQSTAPELATLRKIDGREKFQTRELEMWPVDDGEDWLDELGHHHFIGTSQCRGR